MNYDELAAYQRSLQALQSRQQHKEAQEKMDDVAAQLRIANLPPAERGKALREHESAKRRRAISSYESDSRANWEVFGFLGGIFLISMIVLIVGLNKKEARIAAAEAIRDKQAAKTAEENKAMAIFLRNEQERTRAFEKQQSQDAIIFKERLAERERNQAQQEAAAKRQAVQEATFQKLFTFRLKRATEGEAVFQYDLAQQYLNGQGVAKDVSVAKEWLKKAAAQGHKKAQTQLAELSGTESPVAR
ncbi:MAG: hypothetical protein EBS05_25695 [Proteobacteria bacterium]|nr:hypothetical protein [Pseudomonadota bacterium]